MTKVWILSDLHVDVLPYELERAVEADVLVFAGDIGGKLDGAGRLWLERNVPPEMPVLFIPGNHDFYGGDLTRTVDRFREKTSLQNVHILDAGQSTMIDETRFVGATLWTDYEIAGDAWRSCREAQSQMTDFRTIKHARRSATISSFNGAHIRHRDAIAETLRTPHDGPTVVVTHHAPSARSLSSLHKRGPLDGAYASDLEWLMLECQPDLWIHGHVHERKDYSIGRTRVVANPRGYFERVGGMGKHGRWEAENPAFDPRLVIDVEPRPRIDWSTIEHAIEDPAWFGMPESAGRLYRKDEDEDPDGGWKP